MAGSSAENQVVKFLENPSAVHNSQLSLTLPLPNLDIWLETQYTLQC